MDTGITVNLTKSSRLLQRALVRTPGGSPDGKWWEPNLIYARSGKGSRLTDVDGNEYIDYLCGAGPIILGHAHPEVNQAVIDTIQNTGVQFSLPHEISVQLAEKLAKCLPCAEMSVFCNAGTDAALFAVRTARTFTERPKVVKFEGGYQGWADPLAISTSPKIARFWPGQRAARCAGYGWGPTRSFSEHNRTALQQPRSGRTAS